MSSLSLYLISQDVNNDYDTYSDAVVAANNKEEAITLHPDGVTIWNGTQWIKNGYVVSDIGWCNPKHV